MAEKKHSALALLDILITFSDEEHILSAKQIQQYMLNIYDLNIERRTLYSNIAILEQAGYEISKYEDNGKGYYLYTRQFDKSEILLLCNAIHASHFISEQQSNDLIEKLLKTQSRYQQNEFTDAVYLPNPRKTPNRELLYNVSLVSEAIRDHKPIRFIYTRYDHNKKMVPRRTEPYEVEPRFIVYNDSRAYMIVTSKKHPEFSHYRLDRMQQAVMLEETVEPLARNMDAYEYARNKLFMFAGDTISALFLCDENILDQMLDIFGTEIFISPQADNRFAIRISTTETGAKLLAMQFLDSVELLEPEYLRDEFRAELKTILQKYDRE